MPKTDSGALRLCEISPRALPRSLPTIACQHKEPRQDNEKPRLEPSRATAQWRPGRRPDGGALGADVDFARLVASGPSDALAARVSKLRELAGVDRVEIRARDGHLLLAEGVAAASANSGADRASDARNMGTAPLHEVLTLVERGDGLWLHASGSIRRGEDVAGAIVVERAVQRNYLRDAVGGAGMEVQLIGAQGVLAGTVNAAPTVSLAELVGIVRAGVPTLVERAGAGRRTHVRPATIAGVPLA